MATRRALESVMQNRGMQVPCDWDDVVPDDQYDDDVVQKARDMIETGLVEDDFEDCAN